MATTAATLTTTEIGRATKAAKTDLVVAKINLAAAKATNQINASLAVAKATNSTCAKTANLITVTKKIETTKIRTVVTMADLTGAITAITKQTKATLTTNKAKFICAKMASRIGASEKTETTRKTTTEASLPLEEPDAKTITTTAAISAQLAGTPTIKIVAAATTKARETIAIKTMTITRTIAVEIKETTKGAKTETKIRAETIKVSHPEAKTMEEAVTILGRKTTRVHPMEHSCQKTTTMKEMTTKIPAETTPETTARLREEEDGTLTASLATLREDS